MNIPQNEMYASGDHQVTVATDIVQNIKQENFMSGIQNARNLLSDLERSLRKTKKYEKQLMKCRSTHSHVHSQSEWLDSELSEGSRASKKLDANVTKSEATQPSRSQVDLAESWSTISIVCLQYQYEELSKRYESLLQAYDERCNSLSSRDAALTRLRERARMTHARLAQAHQTLLIVGEKFLALRERRLAQKRRYEEQILQLKRTMRQVVDEAERIRLELDAQIAESLATERDSAAALLLAEIRKCNLLFLENLRLKTQVEQLAPGKINWDF